MRLLNTSTFELESFIDNASVEYAILSHTWGGEEVLFQDARNSTALMSCSKEGLRKVLDSCGKAREANYQYIWIDTCCIDKSSSAELSEAINSMFAWYRDSKVCYAYLADVDVSTGLVSSAFDTSRWFTRGWTLQEPIAPPKVKFYDCQWNFIGERSGLGPQLGRITKIDERVLRRHVDSFCSWDAIAMKDIYCRICRAPINVEDILESFSLATRMSWAAKRQTTRREDTAYCLLGIFNVNMPLLYGEGDRAFRRLQEEIIRKSNDQSILAWEGFKPMFGVFESSSVLADSPSRFGARFETIPRLMKSHQMTISSGSLEVDVLLGPCHASVGGPAWLAVLNCRLIDDHLACPAILLEEFVPGSKLFRRHSFYDDRVFELFPEACGKIISEGYTIRYDTSEFNKQKILLDISNSDFNYDQKNTPPVRFNLVDPNHRFVLEAAVPSKLQGATTGNIISFWLSRYSNSSHQFYAADLCGAYCFTDGASDGFFVLWGVVDKSNESVASSSLVLGPNSWWEHDRSQPYCNVHSWSAVAGRRFAEEDISLLTDGEFYANFLRRLYPPPPGVGAPKSLTKIERKDTCAVRIDSGCTVSATITRAEFLDRKCFQLTVEVLYESLGAVRWGDS